MTIGKRIGYIRVSTIEQNPERQLEGIELDKKFIDYASGTTIKRPQLEILLEYAREDDTILVHSMDRLARNVKDLLKMVDDLVNRGVVVHFLKENLSFNGKDSAMSKLLLMLLGAVAKFEHSLIRERQREGVEIAKKSGRYKGRKKKLDEEKIKIMQKELLTTRKTKTRIAEDLGISRFTLYRYLEKINLARE
jgi:DNA invertase Pin-like site-specific DNA recombinase